MKKILGINLAAGCSVMACFGLLFVILLGFAVDQLPFGLSELGWAWMQGRLDAVDAYNVDILIASSYSGEYCAPGGLPGGGAWRITQVFHDPSYNPNHAGIDFGIPLGTATQSTIGGEVTYAGWNSQGYGNLVIVQNGPVSTYYGHLSGISVHPGQIVSPGALLGLSGDSGNSTGPHLHYEVRVNGVPVDPLTATFGDVVCGQSAAQANPAPVEVPGAGGALDTPPVRLEGDPATVEFRVVSAYGRYDPEPGAVYGRVMGTAGNPLGGIVVEVLWGEESAQCPPLSAGHDAAPGGAAQSSGLHWAKRPVEDPADSGAPSGTVQTTTGPDGQFLFQVYQPAVCVAIRIANDTSQVVTDLMTGEGSYDIFFKQNSSALGEDPWKP